VHGLARVAAVAQARDLLARVRLEPRRFAERYPHELSGDQRQRVNIARALALQPRLIILDEAVSALDKSVEAQVLNLLLEGKDEFGLTGLFISHALNVVRFISDRVMVMYLGQVVEIGASEDLFEDPRHPYTKALLSSIPSMDACPHELSGGMRQRAMIALALACKPQLLLADEPTTAPDATVQIQILLLLRELQREMGPSVIFVTHDIGASLEVADRISVMYAGRIVEVRNARTLIRAPRPPKSLVKRHAQLALRKRRAPQP